MKLGPLGIVSLFIGLIGSPAAAGVPVRSWIEQFSADRDMIELRYRVAEDSRDSLEREQAMEQGWLERVRTLDFSSLPPEEQVDAVLLRNTIERELDELDERREARTNFATWVPFRDAVTELFDRMVKGEPVEPEKAAGILAPLATTISRAQESLKAAKGKKAGSPEPKGDDGARETAKPEDKNAATPIPMPTAYQALQAAKISGEISSSLKRWFENYRAFLPEFGWWVQKPYEDVQAALESYGKYLREEIAGVRGKDEDPLLGKAIGAALLRKQLDREFIPYSPEELIGIAEREVAWCEGELVKAAREMGLGDDWKSALARVKEDHVRPGEQEAFCRAEAKRVIAFLKERGLVTIPADCEENWGSRMMGRSEQRVLPYAVYSRPDVALAYATDTMSQEDKLMSMRGNNRAFTRTVIPHELIPGHHLQGYMAARQRPYRRMFSTTFLVEGWALYWEMRLWELGYPGTPENRIGALFWRLHRCARIIVSLKFHAGQMTPAEMVDYLVTRVGHERLGATSEVRRYIGDDYGPLYQIGYMIGGLQLIALHKELVVSGKLGEREFHDAILTLGPIPVELIRASLLKQPLDAGFRTQWRFN